MDDCSLCLVCTQNVLTRGLSMAQNRVHVHRDLQRVWLTSGPTLNARWACARPRLLCPVCCEEHRLTSWRLPEPSEGYQQPLKATSILHMGLRRREVSSSQLSVVPGRHFCAAGTTNGTYRTTGHSCCPRGQSHSFCCSAGHRTVMEKSTTRTVTDVTERISKDTKHLCLDSWVDAGTSTH